jgi:hypothetical protein
MSSQASPWSVGKIDTSLPSSQIAIVCENSGERGMEPLTNGRRSPFLKTTSQIHSICNNFSYSGDWPFWETWKMQIWLRLTWLITGCQLLPSSFVHLCQRWFAINHVLWIWFIRVPTMSLQRSHDAETMSMGIGQRFIIFEGGSLVFSTPHTYRT